jgi:hypothetical protein
VTGLGLNMVFDFDRVTELAGTARDFLGALWNVGTSAVFKGAKEGVIQPSTSPPNSTRRRN